MAKSKRQSKSAKTELPLPFDGRLGASVDETAAVLSTHRATVHRLIASGQLTASKVGWRTIVHVASIHRLLAKTVIKPRSRVRRAATIISHPGVSR
jgi:excisionase family DNA binding protein